jgi:hypothetical protein
MQFTGALAEQHRFLRINAADQFCEERTWRGLVLEIGLAGEDPLEVTADRIERERPGVALIRDRALEQANHGGLVLRSPIFNRTEKCRDVRELRVFSEETRHFHIGVHAILELPVKFQEKLVLEEHRRITLFRAQDLRGGCPRLRFFRKRTARQANKVSALSSSRLARCHQFEKCFAERFVVNGIV